MVRIKGVQAALQINTSDRWYVCKEFDSHETLEQSVNSATRQATIVECEPGLFRFVITLAENFKWANKANALKISLTFDEGDPIKEYEVVVLKPDSGDDTEELGLESLRTGSGQGEPSAYCLEAICMPLRVDDPSSPWLNAAFEFMRYSRDTAVDHNGAYSTSKGRIRIDVVQCTVERNPRRNDRIALVPKLDPNWRSLPPANNVTLKPELRFDPLQLCSTSRRYKCKPIPDVNQVSFTFLYREAGQYVRIEKEDIDVIEDEAASTPKPNQGGRKGTYSVPKPDSTNRSRPLHHSTAGNTPVGRKHSSEAAHIRTAVFQEHTSKLPDLADFNAPAPSSRSSDASLDSTLYHYGDYLSDNGGLISLLETTTGILSQIEDMRRKEDLAEQDFIRTKLEQALREKARLQSALDDCKSEINRLRDEDKRVTMRMQNIGSQDREDESDEERKIRDEAMKAIQKLHDIRSQKLETRKRRVSQWTTSSSPPSRGTKRTRRPPC